MTVTKKSLGVDASGFEKFEVKDATTGEVIGYDLVAPADSEQYVRYENSRLHNCLKRRAVH